MDGFRFFDPARLPQIEHADLRDQKIRGRDQSGAAGTQERRKLDAAMAAKHAIGAARSLDRLLNVD